MLNAAARRFASLPTAAKLLLILTAALLPIGIALTWLGESGIRQANDALQGRSEDQAKATASAIESLIARNALALRIAAAGAIHDSDPCISTSQSLATAPAISNRFSLRDVDGKLLCTSGGFEPKDSAPLVAPGDIQIWVDPDLTDIDLRVGVVGGFATASLTTAEVRAAALTVGSDIRSLTLSDRRNAVPIIESGAIDPDPLNYLSLSIANGALTARIGFPVSRLTTADRVILLLPVLMWILAALSSWLLVSRLLIRPLKRLQQAVTKYQPGEQGLDLPRNLGPATEIQGLRDAFGRAVTRVEDSEREMADALDGQRRLVREVHHRVKNNLQVVASLLNIHGRSAETTDARAAYAGIGRRVGALSIVHRNHFAEMEENRGIALRPLLAELSAELRAGAPVPARKIAIDLELESVNTTQDVAVAVSFLVTEIVEFAMLNRPEDPVEISLRRTSPLTARLTLNSPVLVPEEENKQEKAQFERIVAGLAKQLRSTLERKLGRYSVDLPVFPQL
ncbi:MAG TPA: sensor histidine kinase [Sphingomicrobium sp.]